jgi:hypothetical protein
MRRMGGFCLTGRTRTFSGPDEAILKPGSPTTRKSSVASRVRQMIEAVVAVILALFCAGIFLAHAVDAYRDRND